MPRGCIVLLDDVPQPALLMDECDRLCRILLAAGNEMRVGAGRVRFVDAVDQPAEGFGDVARQVAFEAARLDLGELWAVLEDAPGPVERAEACELLTGERAGLMRLAFELRLADDPLHFDVRDEGLRPRKRRAIEQEILRRDRQAAQRREFDEAVAYVLRRLAGGTSGEGTEADLPSFFSRVREAALAGDDAVVTKEVRDFLERVGYGSSSPWAGPCRASFELLRELGVFRAHEDLNLVRHGVERLFPDWMLVMARDLPYGALEGRPDRTDLDAYTIDDVTTRDYDDALALEEGPGGARLHVLIADPTQVLDPGSPLWKEARRRGSTIYHPEGKVPMLPPNLSEGHLSLVEQQDRPALDFVLHLGEDDLPWAVEVARVRARVRRNLTYDRVDALLVDTADQSPEGRLLRRLRVIADRLQAQRIARGALIMRKPEVAVRVSREGNIEISRFEMGPARDLVVAMMIACGGFAAMWLRDRGVPAVYRKQARATEPGAGPPVGIVEGVVACSGAVRSLRRAEVSLHPGRHEGLGLEQYVQITSPLRRFQDLQLHEQVRSTLVGGAPRFSEDAMLRAFAEIEDLSARNQRIQQDAKRYWLLRYLVVTDVQQATATPVFRDRQGWRVYLDDYGVEAVARLRPDAEAGVPRVVRIEHVDPRDGVLRVGE